MKLIPLNSLVILAGVSLDTAITMFDETEFIEASDAVRELQPRAKSLDSPAYLEYVTPRITFKLKYGERVVLHAPQISYDDKTTLVAKVRKMGYHVVFLYDGFTKDFPKDTDAEPIDATKQVKVVKFNPDKGLFDSLRVAGFAGVKVIPDVHGDMNSFRSAVRDARAENMFMLFLGDLLDYGPNPIEVINEAYHLVVNGEAEILMGNHERKIFRYLNQVKVQGESRVKLSSGNLVTLSLLAELPGVETNMWVNKFHSLVSMMRHHRNGDNFVFSHAGANTDFTRTNAFRLTGEMETVALFGEIAKDSDSDSSMVRAYGWMDTLPENITAVVGHDNRGFGEPLVIDTANGATVYFMDTGCGKGGHLTTLDIKFNEKGSYIDSTNRY